MKLLNKTKGLPVSVKASVAFFLASVVTKGIAYITTPIFTRLLTSQEYGQVSVYLTWLQVFGIIAMFSLAGGVFNNGMSDYPDKRDEYSFSMLMLSNVITLCFTAIILCLYPVIKTVLDMDLPLLILMCVIFLFQPAYNFWIVKQRYEYKYKSVIVFSILSAILSPLVAVICILLNKGEGNLYPRIFGAEITLIAIYISFYIYLGVKSKFRVNFRYWKFAFLFNLPLIPHYLSSYLLGSADKIMISSLINDSATAYYSVAHSVAAVVLIIWSAVNASLVPFTYEKCKVKDYSSVNKVVLPILTFFGVACLGVIMLAPEVVFIMATEEYMQAIYVIPPIVGGVFFQVQYYVSANVIYYHKKPKYVMIASITSMLLNILLNYIFIPKYGFVAAGYTTLFCYALQATIDYIALRFIVKEPVYNMKFICLLSVSIIALSVLSVLIYDYWYIRYSILGVLAIVALIFRKKIFAIFKNMKNKKRTEGENL